MGKLKFYLDESVAVTVASGLRRRGIEVETAAESGNLGLSDEDQLAYAVKNDLVIVTHDADFLSIAINFQHKGIVYAHLQKYSIGDLIRRLRLLWEIVEKDGMFNHVEFL